MISSGKDKNFPIILLGSLVIMLALVLLLPSMVSKNMIKEETPHSMILALNEQNKSKESGTATLEEKDGKIIVRLDLKNAPKGVRQPAHIHVGACPTPGKVKYDLTFPVDGKSETTLNITWDQLTSQGPLALNIHKSTKEASVYVACGDFQF